MSLVTEELKAEAEVYYGDQVCREKFSLLLAEIGLPDGLLSIQDIEEYGYVKEIGFVWLKLEKKREHRFDNIMACYDTVVTAYFEQNKIKNLTGVKAKDFLVWFTLNEIHVKGPPEGSVITFKVSGWLVYVFSGVIVQSREGSPGSKGKEGGGGMIKL